MQNCCNNNNNNNNKEKQVMLISNYCLLQLKQLYTIALEFAFCKNKIPTQKSFIYYVFLAVFLECILVHRYFKIYQI